MCSTVATKTYSIPPLGQQHSPQGNLSRYHSIGTHQWAMYTTWLWGILNPRALDLIAEFATSSLRTAFPRKAGRNHHHVLAMAALCQPIPYAELKNNSHVQGPVEMKARTSRLPPPQITARWKDWHIVSVVHKVVQKDQQVRPTE